MAESLADIRARIHKKSHEYFTFGYSRRERAAWKMFYGATDALLDASMAATAFGRAVQSDAAIDLLVCYGFLQAIYIQQDAVWTLSRSVELKWHPNDNSRIREIRDIRNRLTGHPASAGEKTKPTRMSSAIISYDEVKPDGFKAYIYFEDKGEPIEISVATILSDNEAQLSIQMQEIEAKMDEQERQFRMEQAKKPLGEQFGQGFDYLVQRLHCDLSDGDRLPQAQTHAVMIRDRIKSLMKEMEDRGFASTAIAYDFGRILSGLQILERIMLKNGRSEFDQHEFDLVFVGIEKSLREVRSFINEIDGRLKAPVTSS